MAMTLRLLAVAIRVPDAVEGGPVVPLAFARGATKCPVLTPEDGEAEAHQGGPRGSHAQQGRSPRLAHAPRQRCRGCRQGRGEAPADTGAQGSEAGGTAEGAPGSGTAAEATSDEGACSEATEGGPEAREQSLSRAAQLQGDVRASTCGTDAAVPTRGPISNSGGARTAAPRSQAERAGAQAAEAGRGRARAVAESGGWAPATRRATCESIVGAEGGTRGAARGSAAATDCGVTKIR